MRRSDSFFELRLKNIVLSERGACEGTALPADVATEPFRGGHNVAIDTIDSRFQSTRPIEFARIRRLRFAENVTNNGVRTQ